MTRRYYHLLADGKTVKEITETEYRKRVGRRAQGQLFLIRGLAWIHVWKDGRYNTIPLKQLQAIFPEGFKG